MNAREAAPVSKITQSAATVVPGPAKQQRRAVSPFKKNLKLVFETSVLPLLVVAVILFLWEVLTRNFKVPLTLLPPPSYIYTRMMEVWPVLMDQAVPTTVESIVSFLAAIVIGITLGSILASFRLLNAAFYPIIVFFQLIPKIALAPLFVVWVGIGSQSRIEFATFMAFFPIVVSTMAGLRATPPEMLRMCKGLTASGWQVFTLVRLPYAIPHIFSGMKVAITLAIIGVIVAEFISAPKGLGYLIVFASSQADTALIMAAILVLCVVGLILYGTVALLERICIRRYG